MRGLCGVFVGFHVVWLASAGLAVAIWEGGLRAEGVGGRFRSRRSLRYFGLHRRGYLGLCMGAFGFLFCGFCMWLVEGGV